MATEEAGGSLAECQVAVSLRSGFPGVHCKSLPPRAVSEATGMVTCPERVSYETSSLIVVVAF